MAGAIVIAGLIGWLAAADGVPVAAAKAAALRRTAMELAYDLDRPQAIALLDEAVRLDPDHPANHRLIATLAWLRLLWDRGVVTVDDYQGKLATKDVALPSAAGTALAETYAREIALARQLAEKQLAARPNDPSALYEIGAIYGLESSYNASVDGRMLASFGVARKAYAAHSRALARDPQRKEAGYYLGAYRCLVAELPAPIRWLAVLGGLRGNKAEGLALLEAAAREPGEAQGQARYTLILIYNRDRRYADALRILEEVRHLYPRNRQFQYETAATLLRANQPARALDLLTEGIERFRTDDRPRWFGEQTLWHYKRALALRQLARATEARQELEIAQTFDAPASIKKAVQQELAQVQEPAQTSNAPRDLAR
jgi:tetratricopeptide (TPR) repeat protein